MTNQSAAITQAYLAARFGHERAVGASQRRVAVAAIARDCEQCRQDERRDSHASGNRCNIRTRGRAEPAHMLRYRCTGADFLRTRMLSISTTTENPIAK